MGLSCGLIGLPNVGKTTVFNALVGGEATVAKYPFSTVETNIGISTIPDPRLSVLARIFRSKKMTPSTLEVRDIAGLVPGASQGEGLGNQFLAQIREVEALVHVVRCFEHADVAHVLGGVDPLRDIALVESELLLADLATLERRRDRLMKRKRAGESAADKELTSLEKVEECLHQGIWLAHHPLSADEQRLVTDCHLLSSKPVLYVANVSETGNDQMSPFVQDVVDYSIKKGAKAIVLQGDLEAQLTQLPETERLEFFKELGLHASGLQRLVVAAYELLGLITFFTASEEEARAWTVRKGTRAHEAAGKIHSDMQRGFIRAEVFSYEHLVQCGTPAMVREKGYFRLEGRDYLVQDGDILYFRFHV
ncbi:MAG: redox-regulated ATPase YchF [Nitrospirae bacterium]|nr:MAG: redox-regulated ATPase YchF [Nitrospirota bacterium]